MANSDLTHASPRPDFGFTPPAGYDWLIDHKLVSFGEDGNLQPWYYLPAEEVFSVTQKWEHLRAHFCELIAFARRQDCDDIACFCVVDRSVQTILVVHGWTEQGFDIVAEFEDFWGWLKSVISDIAEWVALGDDNSPLE